MHSYRALIALLGFTSSFSSQQPFDLSRRGGRSRCPRLMAILLVLIALGAVGMATAQANGSLEPTTTGPSSHESLPPQTFEVFVPYWTIEAGWRSELHLRNN